MAGLDGTVAAGTRVVPGVSADVGSFSWASLQPPFSDDNDGEVAAGSWQHNTTCFRKDTKHSKARG